MRVYLLTVYGEARLNKRGWSECGRLPSAKWRMFCPVRQREFKADYAAEWTAKDSFFSASIANGNGPLKRHEHCFLVANLS